MAVDTDLDRAQYATNGTTGPFTVPFYFLLNEELGVTYTDATGVDLLLVLDVDYAVTGAGVEAGGTITLTTAYAAGGEITIVRDLQFVQETVYEDGDPFPAKTHERALDRLTMISQQLRELVGRALTFPPSFSGSASLGDAATRASKFLGFDTTGALTFVTAAADSAINLALSLAGSLGAALIGYIQLGFGAVARTILDRLREKVSAKDFGVVMDGVTPNRAAMNLFVAYLNQRGVANRFFGGVKGSIPAGTCYLEGPLDAITSSNVVIEGDSHGGTVLYGGAACTWDLLTFDGSALALYNVGAKDLRFYTPGNCSAGAHLRLNRTINALFTGLHFMGAFDAIVGDGIAQTKFSNIMCSQENRTAGAPRYSLDFKATSFHVSDVHVSDFNTVQNPAFPAANAISVRGCDGIYFSNGHQHGATLFQPTGDTCASVFWSNWYFDTSVNNNVKWTGTSPNYRGFYFSNCYSRDSGGNGLEVNAAVTVSDITWTGGKINAHRLYGFYAPTDCDGIFSSAIFDGNNTDNAAGTGDFYCAGTMTLLGLRFQSGGAAGTAVQLTAASSDCMVAHCSFVASNAGTKLADSGTGNHVRANTGFITKAIGQVTITNPATTAVVNHGLAMTPSIADIRLTLNSASAGVTRYWLSAVTSTQFQVNLDATPTTTATIGWMADRER